MLQVARALTSRGFKVAVANGVRAPVEEEGVLFVPNDKYELPSKALYLQRMSVLALPLPGAIRVIVRANDVAGAHYDGQRPLLESGRAALVANTKWQAEGFTYAKEKLVIPPILDESPQAAKMPGLFVYASGPMKGLDATLAMWRRLHKAHGPVLKKAKLVILSPGRGDFPPISPADKAIGVRFEGVPTPEKYREWIVRAEGLFFVNTVTEVFGCCAALAERSGTRTHILCEAGFGGLLEACVTHTLITQDADRFEADFMEAWQSSEGRERWYAKQVPDRRPAALVDAWIAALQLNRGGSVRSDSAAATPDFDAMAASLLLDSRR